MRPCGQLSMRAKSRQSRLSVGYCCLLSTKNAAKLMDSSGCGGLVLRNRFENNSETARGVLCMKNVYEVLRRKEMDLARVRQEVDALRYVAPLLSEQKEDQPQIPEASLGGPRKWVVAEAPASPAELEALKRRA